MTTRKCMLALMALATACMAWSQVPDSVALDRVVIYGKSSTQRAKEGVFAVGALDIRTLVNSLGSLSEAVDRTAGVKIREEGGIGSDFDLSINGMSGNSVRYFLDGMPLDTKGADVSLANLPVNLIDRIEIYKGVVPTQLGTDALGGAVNIITHQKRSNYLDASYGIGSFHTHRTDLNAQYALPHGIVLRPTLSMSRSKNNYKMRGVEVWNESVRKYLPADRRRFHDDYLSLLGQLEVGVTDQSWADAFFLSASYAHVDKDIQTGAVQTKVVGMADRQSDAWSLSARYRKHNFLLPGLMANIALSHTWDHSVNTDTAYRKYDWNGNYIVSPRNEIRGRDRSRRHIKRPLTAGTASFSYPLSAHHSLSLNYALNRTGNDRYDNIDPNFTPSNDVLTKHIAGLSYAQSFMDGRLDNTFFLKHYINHLRVEQTDLYWLTNSDAAAGTSTKSFWGYGLGSRLRLGEALAVKASYERSVRLPLARELLGNGSTIYANVGLKPEQSHNANLGLFGTWHPANGHTLFYEANAFMRRVDNYIQPTISEKEGMMQYGNEPAIHVKGAEAELRYEWAGRLQMAANISWQDARDRQRLKTDGKPSVTFNNHVPNRPWLFGGGELSYTIPHVLCPTGSLRVGADYQWVHWFFLTWEAYGARDTKARIPEKSIVGALLTYSWLDGRYNLTLECKNLTDQTIYDNYKLQKPGRNFFAKFRVFLQP